MVYCSLQEQNAKKKSGAKYPVHGSNRSVTRNLLRENQNEDWQQERMVSSPEKDLEGLAVRVLCQGERVHQLSGRKGALAVLSLKIVVIFENRNSRTKKF